MAEEDYDEAQESPVSTVVEDGPAPQDDGASGPRCEKCGHATDATACPSCGWYPSLGIHVDVDQSFEAVVNARRAPVAPEDDAPAAVKPEPDWRKHLEVWKDLIPLWGWAMIGTTLGVLAAAIAVRVATLASPAAQTWCGVGGLVGGLVLLLLAHLIAFVLCSFDDADVGVVDLVVKPFNSWKRIAAELPSRLWLANGANLGLSTAVCAALVVGGIPYERLLDWGIKARPQQNLVGAIAQQAAANGDDKSLEEAMGDFADKAGVAGGALAGEAGAEPAEKPRTKLECLIIGYQLDDNERITAVLLAGEDGGKLRYLGRVKPRLKADAAEELLGSLRKNPSSRPFVKTNQSGHWVRPRFTCRVTYTEWPKGQRPKELEWDALLEELSLPW